jgi:hypothetical protein
MKTRCLPWTAAGTVAAFVYLTCGPAFADPRSCDGPKAGACLSKALDDMLSTKGNHTPDTSASLTWKLPAGTTCAATPVAALSISGQSVTPAPKVACAGQTLTVTLDQAAIMTGLAQAPAALSITALPGGATPMKVSGQLPNMTPEAPAAPHTAALEPPKTGEAKGGEAKGGEAKGGEAKGGAKDDDKGGADSKPPIVPIDLPPVNVNCSKPDDSNKAACAAVTDAAERNKKPNIGKKYIIVDETLAVRDGSADFVTESDVVIVRFIVRNALACRVRADSDTANVNDNTVFRLGGEVSATPASTFRFTGGKIGPATSCGFQMTADQSSSPQFEPADDAGRTYTAIDFRFGPFTSNELVFHLTRHDRTLVATDLAATIKIVNHKRYAGWFDIWFGVNFFKDADDSFTVANDNGTQVSRLYVDSKQQNVDLAALAKLYVKCSDGTDAFHAADAKESTVCFGFAAGLSILHPTTTFYPFGLNLTFGSVISLHALLSLNVVKQPTNAYSNNEVFSGDPSTVPTKTLLTPGFALGVGLDPSVFSTLVKAIVTGH